MKMITSVAVDRYGVSYSALVFKVGAFPDLPWGRKHFDCIIFPPNDGNRDAMRALLEVLPYSQLGWVHVAEPDAEYWHDEVENSSVRKDVQDKVGDGCPMTAWFSEMKSLADWEPSFNLGGSDDFLFIFTDEQASLLHRCTIINKKIMRQQEAGPYGSPAAGSPSGQP